MANNELNIAPTYAELEQMYFAQCSATDAFAAKAAEHGDSVLLARIAELERDLATVNQRLTDANKLPTPAQAEPSDALLEPEGVFTDLDDFGNVISRKTGQFTAEQLRAYAKQAIEATRGGVSDAADAVRYRFLRHADLDALAAQYWGDGEVYEGVQLDIAIDEAIAAIQAQAGDAAAKA